MPQGLQCWDSSGNLVVDIGDWNLRYLGSISAVLPTGGAAKSINIANSSLTASGTFVVARSLSSSSNYNISPTDVGFKTYNGGVTVIMFYNWGNINATLDMYAFI